MYGIRGSAGLVSLGLALGCFGPLATAGAKVINLDFGATSIGTATTLDPYHSVTGDAANLSWNTLLGTSNIASGALKYGDGTTVTGVAASIGVTNTSFTTSILATHPSDSSALGGYFTSGIYGGSTSPARDAIFDRNSGANNRGVSLQITGLPAGTYDIYYVARNTSDNNALAGQQYTQSLYAGTSSTTGDFTFNSFANSTITYDAANTQTASWVLHGTYAKLTVNLASGNVLDLASVGGGSELRGFVNSLQIVSVPEPSSLALLGGGSLALLASSRRRRQPLR